MAIEARDAVKRAYDYLLAVSPEANKFSSFRVEEVKQSENKNFTVTLSYEVVGDFAFDRSREYKDFIISGDDGSVVSMTIRKI